MVKASGGRALADVDARSPSGGRKRALVVCAHLRPGRTKRRSSYLMQPIAGLHVASLIDRRRFDVELYHEDWHGPFDVGRATGYDLVFLTGLQPDFDRMRQLAYFFRRAGSTVVAGGSICTAFPEFAARFFDVVCVGGVDSVPEVVADFESGALKPIYRSPTTRISHYDVDYGLMAKSGIHPFVHLVEASRGCSFRCSFCVIPSEVGGHATFGLPSVLKAMESSLAASPRFSFRRWCPLVLFLDNNFSDNRDHMLRVCELVQAHPRVRGWGALVTQNILHDRDLMRTFASTKCMGLFVGLESLDPEMLRRYNKTQNLSRRNNVIKDIEFAESLGIAIGYGYLFDPRFQTAQDMERQVRLIAEASLLPMPTYLSVVAPLAGTASFWADLGAGRLAANLRLRDLDGETICYSRLADRPEALVEFVEKIFRRPWTVVGRLRIFLKTLRRLVRARSLNPVRWYVMAQADLHCFLWSRATPAQARTYLAGSEVLDPQYFEFPDDISAEDRRRYFEPVTLTDGEGRPADWLKAYIPKTESQRPRPSQTLADAGTVATREGAAP